MMMMTNTETLWQSLETGILPSSGLILRRFPSNFLPDISAALRLPERYPALAVQVMNADLLQNAVGQSFRDLKISIRETVLVIELQNQALREIFAVLCDDLAQYLKYETNPTTIAKELHSRLHQWSLLFEKSAAPGLSSEEQQGLFGELIILKMLLEYAPNPLSLINGWQGALGGSQDFFFTDRAIEVKTTLGNRHQSIIISNAAQLDEGSLAFLWLAHLALENAVGDDAKSLNSIIGEILSALATNAEATIRFRAKLTEVGYFESQKSLYDQPLYYIRATRFYQVRDEFPRILPDELRTGVDTVRYSIRLPDCQAWLTEKSVVLKNISILNYE